LALTTVEPFAAFNSTRRELLVQILAAAANISSSAVALSVSQGPLRRSIVFTIKHTIEPTREAADLQVAATRNRLPSDEAGMAALLGVSISSMNINSIVTASGQNQMTASGGGSAGIVVGVLLPLLALMAGAALMFIRSKKKRDAYLIQKGNDAMLKITMATEADNKTDADKKMSPHRPSVALEAERFRESPRISTCL